MNVGPRAGPRRDCMPAQKGKHRGVEWVDLHTLRGVKAGNTGLS